MAYGAGKPKPKPRPRLRPRPRAAWVADDEWIEPPVMDTSITVIEDEDDGWTGLYDAQGRPLYRVKPPMGFVG